MYNSGIKPYFSENNVVVCFSSDENYVPYVGTAINSLIDNSSENNNYDIVILNNGISEKNVQRLISLAKDKDNISIRLVNVNFILDRYEQSIFYVHWHFSRAAYYRLFVPEIFANYTKVLYLDSDIVILDDIAKLFNTNLEDKVFGAMPSIARYFSNPAQIVPSYCQYLQPYVENQYDSYNSAILLFNIPKMIQENFTEKCLEVLKVYKTPQCVDQDLLNIAFPPKFLKMLDFSWVYIPMYSWLYNKNDADYTSEFNSIRKELLHNPKLIHFLTANKPWKPNSHYIDDNKYFWLYLKDTPFFEEIICSFTSDMCKKLLKLEEYEKKEKSNA